MVHANEIDMLWRVGDSAVLLKERLELMEGNMTGMNSLMSIQTINNQL